jgi:hypothetical protein
MSDGPEWFAPKRYGYGSGRPISWQGWAVTIGLFAIVVGLTLLFHDRKSQLIAALSSVFVMFAVITAKTTRGGWRWRWGDDEDSADR